MTDRAVLLLAYGGPDKLDDVAPYLQDVRGGRPTPPTVVEEVRERYAIIGGKSPLLDKTREQAAALRTALKDGWHADVGMRHWHPFIKDALGALAARGITRVVALPMAPHFSDMSVGAYRRACEAAPAVQQGAVQLAFIEGWSTHPWFLRAVESNATAALKKLGAAAADVLVLFTAHSLPEKILAAGDPYPEQLRASAEAVAERMCLPNWRVAYQSAGRTSEKWLGPEAGEVMTEAAASGAKNVLIVPIGFVCDHVEVLYDVDVVYKEKAQRLGIGFGRSASLNASPLLIEALADLVKGAARGAGWS
ncbi:MAG: ferrochelatase [Gemmatimonadales bacterium]